MGVSESKIIAETLSGACSQAERTGRDHIVDYISQNTVFVKSLQSTWSRLPGDIRKIISQYTDTDTDRGCIATRRRSISQDTDTDRRRTAKSRITKVIKDRVTYPDLMFDSCWKDYPLRFFDNNDSVFESAPLAHIYKLSKEFSREKDPIRARFLKVIFYRLKTTLTKTRAESLRLLAKNVLSSNSVGGDLDEITRQINQWGLEGKRIDCLCQDLGNDGINMNLGVLFCLPKELTDEHIRLLPYSGSDREEVIELLGPRDGMKTQMRSHWNAFARNLFSTLWDAIIKSISREPVDGAPYIQHVNISKGRTASLNSQHKHTDASGNSSLSRIYPGPGGSRHDANTPLVHSLNATQQLQHAYMFPQDGAAASLMRSLDPYERAEPLQPSFSISSQDIEQMACENVLNLHENLQRLQPPYTIFNLNEHLQPLQHPHDIFELNENLQPLQSSYTSTERLAAATQNPSNLHEQVGPPLYPYGNILST